MGYRYSVHCVWNVLDARAALDAKLQWAVFPPESTQTIMTEFEWVCTTLCALRDLLHEGWVQKSTAQSEAECCIFALRVSRTRLAALYCSVLWRTFSCAIFSEGNIHIHVKALSCTVILYGFTHYTALETRVYKVQKYWRVWLPVWLLSVLYILPNLWGEHWHKSFPSCCVLPALYT